MLKGEDILLIPEEGKVLSTEMKTLNEAFYKKNQMAYSMLHLSVKDIVSFGAIYNALTTELPNGDAHKAWENLKTIF